MVRAFVLALLAGIVPYASARKLTPQPCPPGRFLADLAFQPLLPGASPSIDAVAFAVRGYLSMDGCGVASRVTLRLTARFTKLTGTWLRCGSYRNVVLTAKIASPACGTLTGRIRARKLRSKTFTAARSACGDGRLDTGGAEQCEAGADQACPGRCGARGTAYECRCPGTTSTTTLVRRVFVAPAAGSSVEE